MELKIEDIIDKHKGQKCIVVGHGPSLNPYIDRLKELKESGYVIIGCNNWDEFYMDCPPDYWVCANNVDDSKVFMDTINKYECTWIYADTVDLIDKNWIRENIKGDFLPYDQRHFGGEKCPSCITHGCDKYLDQKRLTIQEHLQIYTGFKRHYDTGHTVALHMVSFAIIMGFSEIYIVGLDFNYYLGYAKNRVNRQIASYDINHFDLNRFGGEAIADMRIIAASAEKIGTKIYNLNKDSWWGIVEEASI